MMTYQETCEYLYNAMPMFERLGASGYKEGLGNSQKLDEHFGKPHQDFLTIHIAGTNGKGSCSHTISAILQMCGYILWISASAYASTANPYPKITLSLSSIRRRVS